MRRTKLNGKQVTSFPVHTDTSFLPRFMCAVRNPAHSDFPVVRTPRQGELMRGRSTRTEKVLVGTRLSNCPVQFLLSIVLGVAF